MRVWPEMAVGTLCQALAFARCLPWCQGYKLKLAIWFLESLCSFHTPLRVGDTGFSLSAGERNCFRLNRLSLTLESPSRCIMKCSISGGTSGGQGGGEGREGGRVVSELSTWHSLNVRLCNLQVIWDSWERQWKSHSLHPSPSRYKIMS